MNFPQVSFLEWHPFSISSGPDEKTLELHIRSLEDHTKEILEKLNKNNQKETTLWIRVDGPYGNLRSNLRRFPNIVLVAGGIGFSPVIGILKDLYRTGKLNSKAVQNPSHLMEDVHVMWVARSPGQYTWFKQEIELFCRAAQGNFPTIHVSIYITSGKPDDQEFLALRPIKITKAEVNFYSGRPVTLF